MRKFDVHAHFGAWNSIPIKRISPADLAAISRAAGIERSVVSSVRGLLTDLVTGNQVTQDAIEQQDMLFGYIYVDPHRPAESIREVEARAKHPKFIGIKSRDDYHGVSYDHQSYRELFAAIKHLRLPGLLHTYSVASMRAAMELAADYGAPLILAHMAPSDWRACAAFANAEVPPNVYIDPITSLAEPGRYELAVEVFGEDHVVFGTDGGLFHPGVAIGTIESADLSDEVKRKLYWDNAERIFGS